MENALRSLQDIYRDSARKSYLKKYFLAEKDIMDARKAPSLPCHLYWEYVMKERSVENISDELDFEKAGLYFLMKKIGIPLRDYSSAQENRAKYSTEEERRKGGMAMQRLMKNRKFREAHSQATREGFSEEGMQRKVEKRLGPDSYKPDKDELRRLYYTNDLSVKEIAEVSNVSSKTVYRWLYQNRFSLKPRRKNG
jgi:predicted DNA-binding protein YlxM (UPF0122 family)